MTDRILWRGRALLSLNLIELTPFSLVIRRPRWQGTLWIPLERIQKIEVRQNRLDRWMRTGTLRLFFLGGRSMTLNALPDPYEAWKRIKIARFEFQQQS